MNTSITRALRGLGMLWVGHAIRHSPSALDEFQIARVDRRDPLIAA